MTIVDPRSPELTWRSLRSCRDVTRWLEAAAEVPVHTALMQLECVPGEEAVVAAVTFVGVRRRLLADQARNLGLVDFRPALSACVENRDGLADGCLQLIAEEAAGGSVVELARGLHESHGLSAVLALVAVAKDLGVRLVGSLERYPTYGDLYRAETEWMSRYAARLV